MDFTSLGVLIPGCVNKARTASIWRGASPSAAWMTSGLDAIRQHTNIHHFQQKATRVGAPDSWWRPGCDPELLGDPGCGADFSFCRTISGLTKVLVRFAMTLHTWSRILMEYISSSRRT